MGCDRRKFLAVAGITAISALGQKASAVVPGLENKSFVPENPPLTGNRWAMVIDATRCVREEGCTKCIDACHATHNVPDFDNPKDEIKWIWKAPYDKAFPNQEHHYVNELIKDKVLPVMCNHCDNPPCVRVCPTQSTWKREEDGIIMMDMHRCIGCRYCVAACPYGSRSFNWRDPRPFIKEINPEYPTRSRGVVEKCNFCAERLAIGKLPACVEACEEKVMSFGDLEDPDSEVRKILSSRYAIRRKPSLGTSPQVYYLV
jgi:molybdopterin-containing oxidoreductase family iron-sulfur binding subunit